jgi:hypothetical protein
MIRSICTVTTAVLWLASTQAAQPLDMSPAPTQAAGASEEPSDQAPVDSFEELELLANVGETVNVVDALGRETRGRVATLSGVVLTLSVDATRREFAEADVRRIDRRRRDSIWNGLLIGAGAGALVGFTRGRSLDSDGCPRSGIECGQGAVIGTVSGALWGAVGGWIADALTRKRETIYVVHGSR